MSFSFKTFASDEIALLTLSKEGGGRPRQKLESVHEAFLTKDDPG